MISKPNPAYGGEIERESFRLLREDKLYLLKVICSRTLGVLDETLREYAGLDKIISLSKDDSSEVENSPEANLISARRKRYYDFLRRKKKLEESNGDYPAERQAFLDYYSLNLPPDCLTPLCERYIEKRKIVPSSFSSRREEIDQLTATLTTHHSGLVHDLSGKMLNHLQIYHHLNLEEDELLQAGNLGLLIAIHKYDLSRGTRFSTYARWWIHQSIQRYITYTIEETSRHISTSKPLNEEGDFTLEDTLIDQSLPSPEEQSLSIAGGKSRDELFPPNINSRDRQVIEFLFGFYDGKEHTQKEAGDKFKVTASDIGLVYRTSLAKMRKHLSHQEIVDKFNRKL